MVAHRVEAVPVADSSRTRQTGGSSTSPLERSPTLMDGSMMATTGKPAPPATLRTGIGQQSPYHRKTLPEKLSDRMRLSLPSTSIGLQAFLEYVDAVCLTPKSSRTGRRRERKMQVGVP